MIGWHEVDEFIRSIAGEDRRSWSAWDRADWESACRVQRRLVLGPAGYRLARTSAVPGWVFAAVRGRYLLPSDDFPFPTWFQVADPAVDWRALVASHPDELIVSTDQWDGAPDLRTVWAMVDVATAEDVPCALQVLLAPVDGGFRVEADVRGLAVAGSGDELARVVEAAAELVGVAAAAPVGFEPSMFGCSTILSWEWGIPGWPGGADRRAA